MQKHEALVEEDVSPSKRVPFTSTGEFKLQLVQLVFTAALLATCITGVVTFHQTTDQLSNKVDSMLNEFVVFDPATGSVVGPSQALSFSTAKWLSESLKIWILGSSTGSIPQFIQASVLAEDYGAVATALIPLATSIRDSFSSAPDDTNKQIASAADLVLSILVKVRSWVPLQNSSDITNPALSDGLFRLDAIVEWVKSQGRTGPELAAAGSVCTVFLIQLGNINWSGTYTSPNGQPDTWDVNQGMRNFIGDVQPVCTYLSRMQT